MRLDPRAPSSLAGHEPAHEPKRRRGRPRLSRAPRADEEGEEITLSRRRLEASGPDVEIFRRVAALQGLIEQIPNPVLWTESIHELARRGIRRFVEVGPGSVLSGLCRSIEPSLRGVKFGEPADLDPLAAFSSH